MAARTFMRVLVLGGARSGKSAYALALAENSGLRPVMLASAQAGDGEMARRIALHRAQRSERWTTIEEPLDLVDALSRSARPEAIVVIDCLTLWLSNLFGAGRPIQEESDALARALEAPAGPVALVSNEVGCGLVPATALGRDFRDAQGRLNALVARACDVVIEVRAGLPLQIKPAPAPAISF